MLDLTTIPVVFNMTLANAPTSERFCHEARDVIRADNLPVVDMMIEVSDDEELSDAVDYYNEQLSAAGYCAIWNAGDVVVYDLRGLSDEDREEFYTATATF